MTRPRGIRHALRILFFLGSACAIALANQSPLLLSDPKPPLCYCHCDRERGATHCTKMCELPEYEKRWWAVSCHKKSSIYNRNSAPSSSNGSKKTNRKEQALLEPAE